MGSWTHKGSPKHFYCVTKSTKGIKSIESLKTKPSDTEEDMYELKRVYYQNNSDETIKKLVAKRYDKFLDFIFVQQSQHIIE